MPIARKTTVDRRGFLKGAAATVVTGVAAGTDVLAQEQVAQRNGTAQPNPATLAADTGIRPVVSSRIVEKPGSDFMVDVLNNYGDNKMPELLTCCHEESAVAMAHGYAKIEGKPMMALIHGTIGPQHASMAIYNAYADRVPVYMVRDYVKWDDQPYSLGHFAESSVRAYNIAMTPKGEPAMIDVVTQPLHRGKNEMTRICRILTLPGVLLLWAATGKTQTAATGDAKHGKELFTKYSCYACHGFSGENGNGARLVPMKFPQPVFIAYVRSPPRPNQMPSCSAKVLADADLADIYAYIRTLPDSSPPAMSVPILSRMLSENR